MAVVTLKLPRTSTSSDAGEPTSTQSLIMDQVPQLTTSLKQTSLQYYPEPSAQDTSAPPANTDEPSGSKNPPQTIEVNGVKYSIARDNATVIGGASGLQDVFVGRKAVSDLRRPICEYGSEPVKFMVGKEEDVIYIHRNLLACAPGLQKLCEETQSEPVRVPENRLDRFIYLCDWLYTGSFDADLENEDVGSLYHMAILYNIPAMKADLLGYFKIDGDPSIFFRSFLAQVEHIYQLFDNDPKVFVKDEPFPSFFMSHLVRMYNKTPPDLPIFDGWHTFKSKLISFARRGGRLGEDIMQAMLDSGPGKNHSSWLDVPQQSLLPSPTVAAYTKDQDSVFSRWGVGDSDPDNQGRPFGRGSGFLQNVNNVTQEKHPDSTMEREAKGGAGIDARNREIAEPEMNTGGPGLPGNSEPEEWQQPTPATWESNPEPKDNAVHQAIYSPAYPALGFSGYAPFPYHGNCSASAPLSYAPYSHSVYPGYFPPPPPAAGRYPPTPNPSLQPPTSIWDRPQSHQSHANVNADANASMNADAPPAEHVAEGTPIPCFRQISSGLWGKPAVKAGW